MKRRLAPFAASMVLCFALTEAFAGGNANFVLGGRALDETFWEPVEEQGVFGATVDFGRKGWPVQLAAGFMVSSADERVRLSGLGLSGSGKFTGTVGELSFGVMKLWAPAGLNIRPYLGGGLAVVTARVELEISNVSVDDDDTGFGAYAQGGVFWRLGERFNIGVDVRILRATDIDLAGAKGDADYNQAGLVLGWGWD